MGLINKIRIDDIRFKAEHGISKDGDCLELLDYIDTLAGGMETQGSLLNKIVNNISKFVDVDIEPSFTVDKVALKNFLERG